MTQQEFTERTGYYPTSEQFKSIHAAYMNCDKDKDAFCKDWKRYGNIKAYSQASAQRIADLTTAYDQLKQYSHDEISKFAESSYQWSVEAKEAQKKVAKLEAELKSLRGVITAIRMSIPTTL